MPVPSFSKRNSLLNFKKPLFFIDFEQLELGERDHGRKGEDQNSYEENPYNWAAWCGL